MEDSLDRGSDHPAIVSTQKMLEIVSRRLAEQIHEIGRKFYRAVEEEMKTAAASR